MVGYGRIFFRLRLGRPASWRGSGRSRRSGTRTGATAARRPTAPGTPPRSPPPPPRSTTPSDRSRPRRAGSSRDLARRRRGLAQAHGRAGAAGRRLQVSRSIAGPPATRAESGAPVRTASLAGPLVRASLGSRPGTGRREPRASGQPARGRAMPGAGPTRGCLDRVTRARGRSADRRPAARALKRPDPPFRGSAGGRGRPRVQQAGRRPRALAHAPPGYPRGVTRRRRRRSCARSRSSARRRRSRAS